MPKSVSFEFIAPIANTIGIGIFFSLIALSLRIKCLTPSRTPISASEHNSFNLPFKLSLILKVQSKILIVFLKKYENFSNCELVKTGLSRT